MAIKPDPKVIYLSPGCNYDREWCENDVWSECNECGVKSVEYILASDYIDSHRFDEAAELVKFETSWQEDLQYSRAGGGEYEKTFAWNSWKACALAREKEFVK